MGRALSFDQKSSRRALPAGVLSVAVHLGLLWVIATSSDLLPPPAPLSPLRFVGQTFDVDAFGDDNLPEARAPATDSVALASAKPDEITPEDSETPPSELVPAPKENPEQNDETHATIVHKPAPPPRPAKPPESDARPDTQAPRAATPPHPPKKPVDPFDLAVPGDSAKGATSAATSDTGSYGAEGADRPVTDVFKAFLHLFPEANRHSPAWHELPLGPVGRVEFSLLIGKNARLVSIEIHDSKGAPPPKLLIDAIRKTQSYLIHQRLGWEGERREGSERLALTILAEQKSPHPTTPEREGTQRHGRHGEARPAGAFFTFYDGHHIDIELERVSSEPSGL